MTVFVSTPYEKDNGDFNDLPAHVWPRCAKREEDGVVTIAGVPLPEIAAEYGTPVVVIDEDDFRSRCRDMAAAFLAPENVHYASKAFLTRRVARWVDEEGLALDVASENELRIALAANFPPERITVHGNNKSDEFLRLCVESQVGHVVIDSHQELAQLEAVAKQAGVKQDVFVRVKPGVDAHTHEFIATSHEDQKFGISLATGDALSAAAAAITSDWLELTGLHCHVGSQVFDAEGFKLAAERVLGLYAEIWKTQGVALGYLDLGGGYGIAYMPGESPLDVNAVAHDLLTAVQEVADELGIAAPTVVVEPGRAIAGPSAVTVYTAGVIKDVDTSYTTSRRYVAVDGGMSDNIRPSLYGALYDARVVNRFTDGAPTDTRLVGSHCESGDILVEEASWPDDIAPGDLIALAATGAYCYSMASNYNAFGRPAVVSVRGGEVTPMVRRETVEDLIAREY
ncbi:Diaminopimelate decarboxylase [Corynebacterium afermentans subsp. afermentans]|uniref:Diaminopimelate decarboxylase n=1 Tax=Corynebacterium afermentans TaxID=38286 RepID=A0A9X8R2U9_9CORY|nr:diaminopimelate decarboxylase [Corynebacterium afermentans]OAA17069.1 diaminopimelate decarboxylase [Corynebacterium afermentans subsp. afermentans]WJY56535.1 Diaminopimelate decarboxylase [Corynebacterium afermentans subsp. afermentans]SIQ16041.1 diaminopimelate decarboxylase [Corynebacterium afermentans]